MRPSVIKALVAIAVGSITAPVAFAGDEAFGSDLPFGLASTVPASAFTSLGLKPPRSNRTAFGQSEFDMRAAVIRAGEVRDPLQPSVFSGTRSGTRVGLQPTEHVTGVLYPLSDRWFSSVETSTAPATLLGPQRYTLSSQLYTTLGGSWGVSLGLKHSVYGAGGSYPFYPNAEAESGPPSGYLLAPAQYLGSTAATNYQLQFSYLYGERNLFGIAYTTGRDDYLYSPLDRPLHDARQFMLTGQHWLSSNWALNYDVYAPESSSFQRQGLRLGLRYRF